MPHSDPHAAAARIAFRILRGLARIDGDESAAERTLLSRCGAALGLSAEECARLEPLDSISSLAPDERPDDLEAEGEHVLALLLRVAAADGASPREREWLEIERKAWGVRKASFARLALEADDIARRLRERGREQRELRRSLVHSRQTLIAAVLLAIVIAFIGWRASSHYATRAGWHEVEHQIERSLLLIATRYEVQRGQESETRVSVGTGFVVRDGWVATNKHVLQPWKFADGALSRADGWELVESSVTYALWPEGARVLDAAGKLDFTRAVTSTDGSVWLLATAPDVFEKRGVRRRVGAKSVEVQCEVHSDDNNDLALLAVRSKIALLPAPLGALTPPRKTDDVLLVGFPRGPSVFEDGVAECSPVAGAIRKLQSTILVSAPVLDGNSGGPLVDREGRVIAVATRIAQDASMGVCIAIEHLERLIAQAERAR